MNEILNDIGLTKSEIAVYLTLIESGESTSGNIIRNSKISSGKAYLVLNKLLDKGLISYNIVANVKHFKPKSPERLLDYVSELKKKLAHKEEEVQSIIPILKSKYENSQTKTITETFEGDGGFKTAYESILESSQSGESIYVYGVPIEALKKYESYIIDWNVRRIEKSVSLKIIYNEKDKLFTEKREHLNLTEVRYMQNHNKTPFWILISGNKVISASVTDQIILFLIENQNYAESQKNFFEMLWNSSSSK